MVTFAVARKTTSTIPTRAPAQRRVDHFVAITCSDPNDSCDLYNDDCRTLTQLVSPSRDPIGFSDGWNVYCAYFAIALMSTDPEGMQLAGGGPMPLPNAGAGQGCSINGGRIPYTAPFVQPWMPQGRPMKYPDPENYRDPPNVAIQGTPGVYPNDGLFHPEIIAMKIEYEYITYKSRKITIPYGMPEPTRIPIKPRRRTILPGDGPKRCEDVYPHDFICADDAKDFTNQKDACATRKPQIKNPRPAAQKPKNSKHIWPFTPGSVVHLSCFDENDDLGQSAISGLCCDDSSGFPILVPKFICR